MNAPDPHHPLEFPDYDDPLILEDQRFHSVVWVPTVVLRFVQREKVIETHHPNVGGTKRVRILQQQWETQIMNRTDSVSIPNPNLQQWRDVPLFKEEDEDERRTTLDET